MHELRLYNDGQAATSIPTMEGLLRRGVASALCQVHQRRGLTLYRTLVGCDESFRRTDEKLQAN